jgi:23S rRNA-/tRNA-specific pseudouridylate synthase
MAAPSSGFLGFPPPLLGATGVRLPILFDDGDLLVLDKPAGSLITGDPWYPRIPVLTEAIRYQAAQQKPEFLRAGIPEAGLFPVLSLDPDLTGPAIYARSEETAIRLRNDYGSGLFAVELHFISGRSAATDVFNCDLPIARHARQPRMLVSHTTGKKTETSFQLLERFGRYSLWSASTSFLRPHQVPLHAAECQLAIPGDAIYGQEPVIFLSRIKRSYSQSRTRDELPLHRTALLHVVRITLPGGLSFASPPPKAFRSALNQLRNCAPRANRQPGF